jgi:hypothetical protein
MITHDKCAAFEAEIEKLKIENEILREALEKITTIRRKDWNDNEYKGQEVYVAREALKEINDTNKVINTK